MKKKLLLIAAVVLSTGAVNAQYCAAGPSSTSDSNLESASLVGESSSITYTGCPAVTGVEDQTAQMADLTIGVDYTLDLGWGTCGGSYSWAGSAWIDFDGSGTYDADELVADQTGSGTMAVMGYAFTVPDDAVVGETRMRVNQQESGSLPLNPCATFTWGSSVEFTIDLLPGCNEIVVDVTSNEVCEGEMVTIDGEGLGLITWTGGIDDGVAFDPGAPGVYSFIPSSDNPGDCVYDLEDATIIEVFGPTVVDVTDTELCEGEVLTITGEGIGTITWTGGITNGVEFDPGAAGVYTYTPSSDVVGDCAASADDAVTIEVFAPAEITVTDTETCEGDMVTISTESFGTVTWTGGITDGVAFDPGAPGIYTYMPMSDDDNDCLVPEDETITVEVFGAATVIAGAGDLVFCEDEMITLSSAGDADIYIWNDGDDLDLMPGIGTYTFTLTGSLTTGGCAGSEVTDEVTVEVVALPTITASASSDAVCTGLPVVFTGGGGEMYEWDSGVMDGMEYTPESIGTSTYTVWGTDENGCSNMAMVDVEVVDNITISLAGVTIETVGDDGAIDIEVSGGAAAYDYDWSNDGTGEWGDDQDLTGLAGGLYTVWVMGSAGCEASRKFDLNSQVGIEDLAANGIAVYPNPTTDFVNIQLEGTFDYQLVAINGNILVAGNATDNEVIDLKDFASGVYFVNVKNENATTTIKVVKK